MQAFRTTSKPPYNDLGKKALRIPVDPDDLTVNDLAKMWYQDEIEYTALTTNGRNDYKKYPAWKTTPSDHI